MTKKTLRGPAGITLVLDHNDSDTPAMVYCPRNRGSASWDCATGQGELATGRDFYELSEPQVDWLNDQQDAVEAAFNAARAGMAEYS